MMQNGLVKMIQRAIFLAPVVAAACFCLDAPGPARASSLALPTFPHVVEGIRHSVVTVAAAVVDKSKPVKKNAKPDNRGEGRLIAGEDLGPSDDFGRNLLKTKPGERQRLLTSIGSGFVIDGSGLVVTNNHVIEGGEEIYVIFADGTELKVDKILGRDLKTDITLLKVTPKDDKPLKAVSFGDSKSMRVGDWVIAIGNPFGLSSTVTAGIVSGLGRDINAGPYDDFLQTDASINRGNSGGPLFNDQGEVIGVNTAIFSPSGGSIGLGFAIPSNTVKRVVTQLQEFGQTKWGSIGVRLQSMNDDLAADLGLTRAEGALVARPLPGSSAEQAGILPGDIILSIGDVAVKNARHLPRVIAQRNVGDEVDVEVLRQRTHRTLKVKIALLEEKAATPVVQAQDAPAPKRHKSKPLSSEAAPH